MTRLVLAVSGGIDSVALLHMLAQKTNHELIVVAHFDHGIRKDSAEDALFVESLAKKYGYPFETKRVNLGPGASEEKAREARYAFLRSIAKKYDAKIMTAHHADDAIETVAINLHRGTGWRGLAVLDSDVLRPLLPLSKDTLRKYVKKHSLAWQEDSTNASDAYLRNRLRTPLRELEGDVKRQLLALRSQQVESKQQIDEEVMALVGPGPEYSRYFFTHIPNVVAVECLRYITGTKLTRPQLERLLLKIKTAQPNSTYTAGSGLTIDFTTRNFSLSLLK